MVSHNFLIIHWANWILGVLRSRRPNISSDEASAKGSCLPSSLLIPPLDPGHPIPNAKSRKRLGDENHVDTQTLRYPQYTRVFCFILTLSAEQIFSPV